MARQETHSNLENNNKPKIIHTNCNNILFVFYYVFHISPSKQLFSQSVIQIKGNKYLMVGLWVMVEMTLLDHQKLIGQMDMVHQETLQSSGYKWKAFQTCGHRTLQQH